MRQEHLVETLAPPSRRDTMAPDFDLAALAATGFSPDAKPSAFSVPSPVRGGFAENVDLRSAFVLMHANGASSIHEIAEQVCLSIEETIASVVALVAAGLVTL